METSTGVSLLPSSICQAAPSAQPAAGMHQPQLLLDWHGPWLELDCCAVPVRHHPYLLLLVCEDICIIFDQLPDCLLVPWLFQVVTLA